MAVEEKNFWIIYGDGQFGKVIESKPVVKEGRRGIQVKIKPTEEMRRLYDIRPGENSDNLGRIVRWIPDINYTILKSSPEGTRILVRTTLNNEHTDLMDEHKILRQKIAAQQLEIHNLTLLNSQIQEDNKMIAGSHSEQMLRNIELISKILDLKGKRKNDDEEDEG